MSVLNLGATSSRRFEGGLAAELAKLFSRIQQHYFDLEAGEFDYERFSRSSDYSSLILAVRHLQSFDPETLRGANSRLAFWLNIYNIMMLHGVVEAVQSAGRSFSGGVSIRDLAGLYQGTAYQIGRFQLSLDDIEHGILRQNARRRIGRQFPKDHPAQVLVLDMPEPRIHMALFSACFSSPVLVVFGAEDLERQLSQVTADYLQKFVRLSDGRRKLVVPQVFRWYGGDFEGVGGTTGFVAANHPDRKLTQFLLQKSATPVFTEFDWRLNAKGAR